MIVSIEGIEKKFSQHLKQPGNERILFSGKFGTGKSFFLKEYFKSNQSQYNLFWLSPVNYVVGANQDIFEWIKIDIAKQLFENKLFSKQEENYTNNLILQTYLYQKSSTIFVHLMLSIASIIGKKKTSIDFLDGFKSQVEEYKKFKENAKIEIQSNESKIEAYLENAFQIQGSIYEDNLTTRIIRASIELLKLKSDKETVLIIDDLDRLDPEHIFRILNILSAHNDHFDSNKFSFQKVICVCDLDNVGNLYQHRYGKNADFEGYIEKFFTYEPFYFSINDAIVNYCKNSFLIQEMSEASRNTLAYILTYFCAYGFLKIRNIKKIASEFQLESNVVEEKTYNVNIDMNSSIVENLFISSTSISISYKQVDFIKAIFLLCQAFGGVDKFIEAIGQIRKRPMGSITIQQDIAANIEIALMKLSLLARNKDFISGAFFSVTKIPEYRHTRYDHPWINFLDRKCYINLKWTTGNQYVSGDYYEGLKYQRDDREPYTVDSLWLELQYIIQFLVQEEMFSNVKQS